MYGPQLEVNNAKYGGGTGGYTRNMKTYLESFSSKSFELIPSFHTVRKHGRLIETNFVSRLLIDVKRFITNVFKYKPAAVHILAQYRGAAPREFVICFICKILKIPVVYEIKAGEFDTWFNSTNPINKFFMRFIIKNSGRLLCEGKRYIYFNEKTFRRDSTYWPNFVPSSEILPLNQIKLGDFTIKPLKVIFIGFCYEGKGVFELLKQLNEFSKTYCEVELNLVGQESDDFSSFVDNYEFSTQFKVIRHGKKEHEEVLDILATSNVFCLPTRHKGEGHNNSINEAMMLGIPIICTRHGFLEDVLGADKCVYIDKSNDIYKAFVEFINNPQNIEKNIIEARSFFDKNLHSDVVTPKLIEIYKDVIKL